MSKIVNNLFSKAGVLPAQSLASITKPLTDKVQELRSFAQRNQAEAAELERTIADLRIKRDFCIHDADNALALASNLEGLLDA